MHILHVHMRVTGNTIVYMGGLRTRKTASIINIHWGRNPDTVSNPACEYAHQMNSTRGLWGSHKRWNRVKEKGSKEGGWLYKIRQCFLASCQVLYMDVSK